MELDVRCVEDVAVVDLSGKITVGDGNLVLRERLDELLMDRWSNILLNLGDITYLDSSGLAEMVACYRRARKQEGTVKLLSPSERVRDLLRLTRCDRVFEVYEVEADALASFHPERVARRSSAPGAAAERSIDTA